MAISIGARPNHRLQRTGGQRRFVAQWPSHRSVVVQPPPLNLGVDMTSDVKRSEQAFLGLHEVFLPSCIRRAGASNMRRLILLISVGWVPPDVLPSGAGLTRGSRMP